MARQKAVDTKIQVTRGFVTEFTAVGFPQEAAIDIDNCIIDTDGSVRRRPGLDLEIGSVLNLVAGGVVNKGDLQSFAFSTFLWKSVGNTGAFSIVVVQVGLVLQFYNQEGAVSAGFLGEVNLLPNAIDSVAAVTMDFSMTSGLGSLFVVGKHIEPTKVSFNESSGNFSFSKLVIKERDFIGLPEFIADDFRPEELSGRHYYNLLNQGWIDENISIFAGLASDLDLCAATLFTDLPAAAGETWPSNSDIMSVGIVVDSGGNLEFNPTFIKEDFLGNTPAPKGHFILNAFSKDYATASGCVAHGAVVTDNRPTSVVFHQGRIFYTSPVISDKGNGIYYSQNLIADANVDRCYQEADPTASEINDLVATDGGFIPIPGIGEVFKLEEFGNGVIVVASNGVWYITGAEVGSAFTATNLRMDKVHASGALSATSVVQAEGLLYYWGVEGIMQVVASDTGGAAVLNLTQSSIQQFYVSISASARQFATGVFMPEQRKIYWAYRDTTQGDTQTLRNYNHMLILDLDVKGFYKYSIGEDFDNNFPEIMGLAVVQSLAETTVSDIVTDSFLVPVTTISGGDITTLRSQNSAQVTTLKLATMVYVSADNGYKVSFSTFNDRAFVDWRSITGTGLAMDSFVEFAEFNMGAIHTKGKPTYIHSYFSKDSKNLEPGGYYELPSL